MLANFALLVLALGTVGLTGQIRRVPPGFLHPLFLAAGWMSLALLTLGAAVLITWPDSTNGLEGWLILFGLLAFVLLATWLNARAERWSYFQGLGWIGAEGLACVIAAAVITTYLDGLPSETLPFDPPELYNSRVIGIFILWTLTRPFLRELLKKRRAG